MKRMLFGLMLFGAAFSVNAANEEVCDEAASKIHEIIDDWHSFVKEYRAEEKNPSVLAMYRDYKSGALKANFKKACKESWGQDSGLYECFSGVRSEIGAAMCMHPDTNKSDWTYQ